MSELFTSQVEGYAEPQQAEIVSRAGLQVAVGAMSAVGIVLGAGTLMAGAAIKALNDEVGRLSSGAESTLRFDMLGGGTTTQSRLRSELGAAHATLRALERADLGLLRAAAHAEGLHGLERVRSEVRQLNSQFESRASGDPEEIENLLRDARNARREVESVVSRAATRLMRAETAVLAQAVRDTLAEMGYRVIAPRRPIKDAVVVKGQSEQGTSIHVRMEPQHGRVTADLSGFRGAVCLQERQRFLEGLERRGVRVRLFEREFHGRPEGGVLAQQSESVFTEVEDQERERQRAIAWHQLRNREGL